MFEPSVELLEASTGELAFPRANTAKIISTGGKSQHTKGDSPIRILVILEAYSVTGPAKAVFQFAREASARSLAPRVEISFLTFLRNESENAFTRAVRAQGLRLDIINEKGRFDFAVIRQLREAVDRRRPDVIWTNATKSHFLIRLSGLHHKAKWVAFHHGYTTTHWTTRVYNQLDRWSHRGADRVVTCCRKFAAEIAARGVKSGRIRVQHMPIQRSQQVPAPVAAQLRWRLGIREGALIVLSVGRLSKEKGHAELLRAMSGVVQGMDASVAIRLLLVGDGPELGVLKALALQLKLDGTVLFLGHQENVRPYYAIADVFALPSHSEGSPNVLLEAMDAGVAVVATAVGGVPEIVIDGRDALLVEKQNISGMANAIVRVLKDGPLRAQLTCSGRECLNRHTTEMYFGSLLSIFQEILLA